MADWNPAANDIFLKAFALATPEQRRAFLDQACGDDARLRAQVEGLLSASARAGSFLEIPAVKQVPPATDRPEDGAGAFRAGRLPDDTAGARSVDAGEAPTAAPEEGGA